MPSKLPIIKVRTSNDNIVKIKTIAKYNKRSMSKEIEKIIEKHIEDFEKEHNKIEIYTMNTNEVLHDIQDRLQQKPPYGDN